jgi:hypothetical protein
LSGKGIKLFFLSKGPSSSGWINAVVCLCMCVPHVCMHAYTDTGTVGETPDYLSIYFLYMVHGDKFLFVICFMFY